MNLLALTNKNSFKEGGEHKGEYKGKYNDKHKPSHFNKKRQYHDYDQAPRPPKDQKFYKTHQGFHPKQNHFKKERNYEYENRKERGHNEEPHMHKQPYKPYNNHKNYNKNNWKKDNQKQDPERGEEYKKPTAQRKEENKAIFAHQLKNIQKTLISDEAVKKPSPYTAPEQKTAPKVDSKVTAFAGNGIVNDIMKNNDDFIISTLNKEESKYSSAIDTAKTTFGTSKDGSSKPSTNFSRDKRSNLGFRASAAAMFSNQTGGKCSHPDYN